MADGGHNLSTAELLALLRDASLKPDSIAEEMECAGAHPCTAAQIAEARELLDLLQQERTAQSAGLSSEGAAAEAEVARRIAALPEPLALALVRAAGEAQRQAALVELAAAPQKALDLLKARDPMMKMEIEKIRLDLALGLTNTPHVANAGLSSVTPEKLGKTIDAVVVAYGLTGTPGAESVYTDRYLPPAAERMVPKGAN